MSLLAQLVRPLPFPPDAGCQIPTGRVAVIRAQSRNELGLQTYSETIRPLWRSNWREEREDQ